MGLARKELGNFDAADTVAARRPATGETTARHPVHAPIVGQGATGASIGRDEITVGRFRAWQAVLGLAVIAGSFYFAMPAFGALTGNRFDLSA